MPELGLEGAVASGLGFIPYLRCNLGDAVVGRSKYLRAYWKAEPCEICDQRFAEVIAESFRQDGAREARLFCERRDRPMVSGATVHEGKSLSNFRIACCGKPAGLADRGDPHYYRGIDAVCNICRAYATRIPFMDLLPRAEARSIALGGEGCERTAA